MNFRQKLRTVKILKFLASLKLTVTCLILLFILTLWGTISQVQNGLYLAQEKFFHSFFFLAMGFLPFPGAQLVMWILLFNLISVLLIRFVFSWKRVGILIIHGGLLLFLISGYVTLHCTQDSHLTLKEGQAQNVSFSFDHWELAIWEASESDTQKSISKNITAVDINQFKLNQNVSFEEFNFTVQLKEYCRNCAAFTSGQNDNLINASGIKSIEILPLEKEPEKNTPGAVFMVNTKDGDTFNLLVYGAESLPTTIKAGGKFYNLSLRQIRYPLPFTLKLIDFIKEEHPGTDTASSYKSRVAIETNGVWREKLISMNNPLRYKDFTFYQSSFSVDKFKNETSTLAVVKNKGRILPYLSTFVTFAGLVIHFVMMAFQANIRNKTFRNKNE